VATRILPERDGMIVVALHRLRRVLAHVVHDLGGIWTVIDDIPENPQLVVVPRKHGQRFLVGV